MSGWACRVLLCLTVLLAFSGATEGQGRHIVPRYTQATLPAVGFPGALAYVTDGVRGLRLDTGTQWIRITEISSAWFGTVGDGVTDNAAAFSAAYAALQNTGVTLFVPSGTYVMSSEMQTYQLDIVGATDPRPIFKPTAAATRTFRIGSATINDVTDKTRLENIDIDLVNAPNGHVAIEGTKAVSQKHFRRIQVTNSSFAGGRAATATKNHTCLKLVFAAGQSASYDIFEHLAFTYCYTGIDLDNIANGISASASLQFRHYSTAYVYRALVVNGVNPLVNTAHLSFPTDADVSLGDYLVKMISQGGVLYNLWADVALPVAGSVRIDMRTQVIGGNITSSAIQEIDTAGAAVANLSAAPSTVLMDNEGLHARDAMVRDTKPNWIVNPDFRWWFRGTTFANPASSTVTAEGWKAFRQGTNTYAIDKEGAIVQYSAQSLKLAVTVAGSAGAPSGGIEQDLAADFGFRSQAYVGRSMSLGVIARGAVGGETLYLNAFGTVKTYTLTTSFNTYVVTAANPNSDLSIIIGLADSTTGTIYLDTVMLYPGAYYANTFRPHTLNEKYEMNKAPFSQIGGKYHYYGTAAPTASTWAIGDRVWNTGPTEAGGAGSKYVIQGWVCTGAGTPGTWLEMRTLTGN